MSVSYKYQIVEARTDETNAFSKAPRDISRIADACGFMPIVISESASGSFVGKIISKLRRVAKIVSIAVSIKTRSIIFVQSPCFAMQEGIGLYVLKLLKKIKGIKIITLVHDADEFRFGKGAAARGGCAIQPLIMLADRIIVHNSRMLAWYKSIGVESRRLVTLEVFDYLTDKQVKERFIHSADFHTVVITSNLNPKAAVYLKFLKTYSNLRWELFGPNFSEQDTGGPNIIYNGVFKADELPNKLPAGFGLVWYGDSKDTCNCYFKEYLKIINPHKTSAYLSAGIPVVVWKDMGVADFVKANAVGLCINSLDDIEDELARLTSEQLEKIQIAANNMSQKLRSGYYTTKAIETCLASINGDTAN